MGVSDQQNQQYGQLTSASGFATGLGESDLTASSNFMQDILGGDSSRIAQSLAPEISAAKNAGEQEKKTTAVFGSRSGGTAAAMNAFDDKTHAQITDLIGSLTKGAADGLASAGGNLLGLGMSGSEAGFGEASKMQQQKLAKLNDIFSSSAAVVGGVAGMPGVSPGVSQGLNAFAGILDQ